MDGAPFRLGFSRARISTVLTGRRTSGQAQTGSRRAVTILVCVLRNLSRTRAAAAALVAVAGLAALLWLVPSDSYLFLPDRAQPVAPLVKIASPRASALRKRPKDGGGIYFVNIVVRKASLLERIFPSVHDGSTLVDRERIAPPGVSDRERRRDSLREMARSQSIAAAVALRALGYKVVARPAGALVAGVVRDAPAAGKLERADVVIAVDGVRVRTPGDLRRLIGAHRPGDSVRLSVRGGRRVRQVELETIADPDDGRRPIIGVLVEQAADIKLPLRVRIDSGGIGGPSAGLAFALDVMEQLGRDVDRGYRVAATGEIELDGRIESVGGLKQKTIGARQARVDVFLVPGGENTRDARRHADGLRVVPVRTFQQALRSLATLPPK